MAATFPDAELNYLADQEAARWAYGSIHTASPGTTGANEATGGSPAYARKALTFNAAGAAGPLGSGTQPATVGVAWSNEVTFDAPSGTYSHMGGWSASTAGTFRGGNTLAASQTLSSQGTVKVSFKIGPVAGS
jgi:hypothetical protein